MTRRYVANSVLLSVWLISGYRFTGRHVVEDPSELGLPASLSALRRIFVSCKRSDLFSCRGHKNLIARDTFSRSELCPFLVQKVRESSA